MFTNYSNLRLDGDPFQMPTLPPLKIKPTHSRQKRKSSNPSINSKSIVATNPKSKSKVTSNSSTALATIASKDANKKGKKKKKPAVEGDAVVVELESEVENSLTGSATLDQNANSVEPFDEQISKDIALAVAMIVAEHEMLKLKYPGKYNDDNDGDDDDDEKKRENGTKRKKKSKTAVDKDKENKKKSDQVQPQQQEKEPAKIKQVEEPPKDTTTPDKKVRPESPPKTLEKSGTVSASPTVVTNDNAATVDTPSAAVSFQPSRQMPPNNESSTTFTVPSRSATTALPASTTSQGTISTVGSSHSVSSPPLPSIGVKMGSQLEVLKYLARVQNYMNHLGYHRMGEPETRINTRLSMKMQMMTAREIIQSALPIKCLHAVVLAVYFTNSIDTVERFPIYFRSHVSNKEYKHIVLGIYVQGHFGALGISRDGGLQDKPTSYAKLSDLIFEFAKCYGQSGHILNEVKFGNLITHDQHSLERLFSKNYVVPVVGCLHSDIERNVEKFAKQLRAKMGPACLKSTPISKFSRSKTSLNGSVASVAGSENTSLQRTRALSMGPPSRGSNNNNNKNDETSRRSSKTAITRSKPAKPSKRK